MPAFGKAKGCVCRLRALFIFEITDMYTLRTSASFDSAHFLAGYEGKCANIHGHRWTVEAAVSGPLQQEGQERGMLLDFGALKKAVRSTADRFDHTLIYERDSLREKTLEALREENFRLIEVPFRPTAENFARFFAESLTAEGFPVRAVTVWETPDNCAVYEVEP